MDAASAGQSSAKVSLPPGQAEKRSRLNRKIGQLGGLVEEVLRNNMQADPGQLADWVAVLAQSLSQSIRLRRLVFRC